MKTNYFWGVDGGRRLWEMRPEGSQDPDVGFIPLDGLEEGALRLHPGLARLEREKNYEEVIARRSALIASLEQLDGLAVLGVSGFYTHLWSMRSSLQKKPDYELQVADLEFLQCMVLQGCPSEHTRTPTPDDFQPLWEEVSLQYFSETEREALGSLDPSKAQLAQRVRRHSAYYRNPYGVDFFRTMLASVCKMLDSVKRSNEHYQSFGTLVIALVEMIDGRIERTWEEFAEIHAPDSALAEVAERLSHRCTQARELYSATFRPGLSRDELQTLCHNMLELSLWLVFRFTRSEIVQAIHRHGYDPEADLARCSIGFCEKSGLAATDVWSRPFVRHGNDFYLFSPYTILSFPFHLLLSADGGADASFKSRLERVRGKFLEAEAVDLFTRAFPSATIITNAYWHEASGDRIETDLLIRFENRLIIAESKGAILPDKLRNGNYVRTRTFLRDTFGAGNLQTQRFADRLASLSELDLYDEHGKKIGSLRSCEISEVVPLVLTIEQLGIIANARKLLEVADISDSALFSAMPIMISELSVILKLLPNEITRAHYLSRRSRVFRDKDVLGDEMDLFMLYVIYGYSAKFLSGDTFIWALGASYSLRDYLGTNGELVLPHSSTVPNTPFFSSVLESLARERRLESLDACFAIMDVPHQVQSEFERALKRMRLAAAANRRRTEYCKTTVKSGIASVVLLGAAFRAMGAAEIRRAGDQLTREAIKELGVKEGLLIDVGQRKTGEAYSSFAYRKSARWEPT